MMTNIGKKIGIFILILLVLMVLGNIIFRLIIPTAVIQSNSMAPTYNRWDVLFYRDAEQYNVDDIILYNPSQREWNNVARIIEENPDGTFKVKGDANQVSIKYLDQEMLRNEQIIGKVTSIINPFIFFILLYGIQIVIALALTYRLTRK